MRYGKKGPVISLLLLLGILLITGCGKQKESNIRSGNEIPRSGVKQEKPEEKRAEEEKKEEKENVYIILQINTKEQKIRLQSAQSGKISEYGISDATAYRDKYGEFTSAANITPGKMVEIGAENAQGNLSGIQLSDRVWEQENVERFSIEEEKNMIVIGDTKYYYDDSLLVFLDDEQISLDTVTENDRLRIAGMGKKVASVSVTSGHGFLVLTHTELFEGGSIAVGKECILQIEKDMKIEVPEGTYQVTAANDGYGDTKEVSVKRNETTSINLEEYKGEGVKSGKVSFVLSPEGTKLAIDGKKVDPSQPVELKYGIHELTVVSEKYGVLIQKLLMGSKEAEVVIDMKKEMEKEEEEKKETSSDTKKTSSSKASSGAGSKSGSMAGSYSTKSSGSTDKNTKSESADKKDSGSSLDSSDTAKKISDFISTLLD